MICPSGALCQTTPSSQTPLSIFRRTAFSVYPVWSQNFRIRMLFGIILVSVRHASGARRLREGHPVGELACQSVPSPSTAVVVNPIGNDWTGPSLSNGIFCIFGINVFAPSKDHGPILRRCLNRLPVHRFSFVSGRNILAPCFLCVPAASAAGGALAAHCGGSVRCDATSILMHAASQILSG